MVRRVGKYLPEDMMSELICENYPMLLVMSRFGISLGFGDDTIEDTCKNHKVDVYTFLGVVNMLLSDDKQHSNIDFTKISLSSLIKYLHKSHTYFLEYRLPSIRKMLVESLDKTEDVSVVILNYYDKYVAGVNEHMMYEENTLFPYINAMLNNSPTESYSINTFSEHHDKIESRLTELKNIIIKYYPTTSSNELNNTLYNIFSCERDLASHNAIEDYLLVPVMQEFENSKKQ
ncbi:MAG: hemerythrin domain-containing protein [Rikenellaceae bacterium]